MDRRTFVAVGASAAALTATAAAAGVLPVAPRAAGERVTISGWMRPAATGPGHYFILGPSAGIADPRAEELAQWPDELTLVYPRDAAAMRAGKVTLEGRLDRGRFKDMATGHASRRVLADARLV